MVLDRHGREHAPAGSSRGGEFTSKGGAISFQNHSDEDRQDWAEHVGKINPGEHEGGLGAGLGPHDGEVDVTGVEGAWASAAEKSWVEKMPVKDKKVVQDWQISSNDIRESLASGKPSAKAKHFVKVLDTAPAYQGEMFRGMGLTDAQLGATQVGGEWKLGVPSSFTKSANTAMMYAGKGGGHPVLIQAISKTGASIHGTGFLGMKEVVSKPNTSYRVVSKRVVRIKFRGSKGYGPATEIGKVVLIQLEEA